MLYALIIFMTFLLIPFGFFYYKDPLVRRPYNRASIDLDRSLTLRGRDDDAG